MTEEEKAYLAALIDNFAVLRTSPAGDTDLPYIAISSSRRPEMMEFLGKVTGVKPIRSSRKYTRHNCTEHCPSSHQKIDSWNVTWAVRGVKATIMLYNLLPYLRVQKSMARKLIRAGRTIGYKGQTVNDMVRLGWEIPDLKPQPRGRVARSA